MGFCGRLCRGTAVRLIELTIAFLLVVYMPGLPPEGTFTATTITPSKPLEGPYAINTVLNNAQHIFVDDVRGPESFAVWKDELYSSVHGGDVVKLTSSGKVIPVAKVGQPCDGYWQESKCGRPLGIEFDKSGALYVSDAYYGIWKVNIETGKKQLLVSRDVEIEGKKPKLFNSIALASNGDFYWTDSSTNTLLEDGVFGMLLDGTGRLFHYDAAKNKSRVLLDGLWFANGVLLSPNEDFVIVSETARSQLRRYYVKGEKKGTDDIFIDGLPGVPDNLKAHGNFILMPLVSPRDDAHPVIFQSMAPHPMLRKFVARIIALIEMPFKAIQRVLPHYIFERVAHWIGHFESVQALVPKRTTIVKVDWSGNVLESWHNIDGTLTGISEAIIFKNNLYLGSPYNTYVGKLNIPGELVQNIRIETSKNTASKENATPKPITPKPSTQAPTPKPTEAPTKPTPTKAPPTPKPTEAPTTPKPSTQAPTPKPTQAPAQPKEVPSTPKPSTQAPTPKPTEAPTPKPTEAPPKVTQPPPKPTQAPTKAPTEPTKAPPKPTEAPPKPTQAPPKPAEPSTEKSTKPTTTEKSTPKSGESKDTIKPVVESIPSDTRPPKNDNIKVIRKEGPSEIPDPVSKNSKQSDKVADSKPNTEKRDEL